MAPNTQIDGARVRRLRRPGHRGFENLNRSKALTNISLLQTLENDNSTAQHFWTQVDKICSTRSGYSMKRYLLQISPKTYLFKKRQLKITKVSDKRCSFQRGRNFYVLHIPSCLRQWSSHTEAKFRQNITRTCHLHTQPALFVLKKWNVPEPSYNVPSPVLPVGLYYQANFMD